MPSPPHLSNYRKVAVFRFTIWSAKLSSILFSWGLKSSNFSSITLVHDDEYCCSEGEIDLCPNDKYFLIYYSGVSTYTTGSGAASYFAPGLPPFDIHCLFLMFILNTRFAALLIIFLLYLSIALDKSKQNFDIWNFCFHIEPIEK